MVLGEEEICLKFLFEKHELLQGCLQVGLQFELHVRFQLHGFLLIEHVMRSIIQVLIHGTLILSDDHWVLDGLHMEGLLLIHKLLNQLLLLPECRRLLLLAGDFLSPAIRGPR